MSGRRHVNRGCPHRLSAKCSEQPAPSDEAEQNCGVPQRNRIDVIQGNVDLHEVTTQLKQSELSFEFAMQVRNKFIDAYREVMRMNV